MNREQEQWIENNLKLISKVIYDNFRKTLNKVEYDDLFQEGYIGMHKAITTFDASLGNKLSSYVYIMVKYEIQNYFYRKGSYTSLRVHPGDNIKYNQVISLKKDGYEVEDALEIVGLDVYRYNMIYRLRRGMNPSFDLSIGDSEDTDIASVNDFGKSVDVHQEAFESEEYYMDYLNLYASSISNERNRDILLDWINGCTHREISAKAGVTQQRCHQIVQQHKERLRVLFKKEFGLVI